MRRNPSFKSSLGWGIAGGLGLATLFSGFVGLPFFWGRVGGAVLGLLIGPLVYGAAATVVEGSSQFGAAGAIIPGVLVGAITGWWLSRPGQLP